MTVKVFLELLAAFEHLVSHADKPSEKLSQVGVLWIAVCKSDSFAVPHHA